LSYKVFNKNQKQLGFLVYELLNEFQPLPGHFIIDVIGDYFKRIIACKCSKEQGKLMKNLDILLSSVSFALNLVTHLPPEKNKTRYNSIVNRLFLVKTDMKINPEASMNDVGPFYTAEPMMPIFDLSSEPQEKKGLFFKDEKEDLNNPEMLTLLEMSLMLQKSMRRTFDDPEEIKIFTMHDKYANDEYYPHNIFENLLQILFGVGEELKAKGEHSIFEISGIWAGYRLIEKVLDDYFKNEMADSSIDLVGSQYMTCRELDICLWWVWSMKDRFEDHFFEFLLLCFKKLESFITISLEPEFLDRVRKSSNPKALVKKHVCFLKFLNKNSTVVLKTSEQYNPTYIQKLQDAISDSKLLDFLYTKLETLPKDKITQTLFTSCVEETINIIVASQCRHLEGYQSSLELIETMKKLDTLMVNHTTKYKFCDLACVIFQILFSNRLIHQAYRIIPATLHKTFFEIMSDLENYNRQRSTSCLTFMFHPIFTTVDFSNYTNDPQGMNVAIQCIIGLLQKLSEAINHLNTGFITFDFNKPRLYDQNLINESIIARLYSRMLRYTKIFHQMLPYFGNLVNYFAYRKQEAELQNLSQIANSIIMNPLLQMVSSANLNAIFSIMKDIYAINSSAFLITTTNMIFARFLHGCHSLGETLKKIAGTKDNARAISCLKSLLEIRENFWLSLSTQHVELFECLGQEAVFSVFILHLTNHFLEKYLVNLSVSKDTLHTLAQNYEKLLNINLDLILLYNLQTPGGEQSSPQGLLTTVDLSGQNNLYTKLILKNITPLLIMTQPENANKVLEGFLISNLNTEKLLAYQPERGLSVLYHQLCAFGVVLNIFIEGHAFFEAFVIQNKLLTPTLSWIYDVMVQYKDIIGGTVKCIPALDKIISKFISLINLNMKSLSDKDSSAESGGANNESHFRLNERQFLEFLLKLFEAGPYFYEKCYPDSKALENLFKSFLGVAYKMIDYKPLHKATSQEPSATRRDSDLKEPEFFQEMYNSTREMIKKGIYSHSFLSTFLSRRKCLNLYDEQDLQEINRWTHELLLSVFEKVQKRISCVRQSQQEEMSPGEPNQDDLFMCFKVLEYVIENPSQMTLITHTTKDEEEIILELQALVKDFIESFPSTTIETMKTNSFFTPFMASYCNLSVKLFKSLEVSLAPWKEEHNTALLDEETSGKLQQYFNLAIRQLSLLSQLSIRSQISEASSDLVHEICIFMISLWWYGEQSCLRRVVEDPDILKSLLENAEDETSLEFLGSFVSLYAMNGFPFETQLEILLKGLKQASFRRIHGNYRIKACQNLINSDVISRLEKRIDIQHHHHTDEIEIELEDPQENDSRVHVTKPNGEIVELPTHHYLMHGLNPLMRLLLDRLFEMYLTYYAESICQVVQGKVYQSKLLRPYFLISLLLKKFSELSIYILSYPVQIKKFGLGQILKTDQEEMNFLEFSVRTNFCMFPGFCIVQEAITTNRGQYLAIQFEPHGKVELLHEVIVQLFLNEILKATSQDLALSEEVFFKNPEVIWKWTVYITQSLDLLFSYSSPRYLDLQTQLMQGYLALLVKYIRKVGKKPHTSSEILMSCLLRSLQKLIETALIRGYNSRVGNLKSKKYLYISGKQTQSTTKLMKFFTFIAKNSRKKFQKNEISFTSRANPVHEENNKLSLIPKESAENMFHRKNEEEFGDLAHEKLEIIGPKLRQSRWWSRLDWSTLIEKKKLLSLRARKIFEDNEWLLKMIEEIDSFSEKTESIKMFRTLLEGIRCSEKVHSYLKRKLLIYIHIAWDWELQNMNLCEDPHKEMIEESPKKLNTSAQDGMRSLSNLFKKSMERSMKSAKLDQKEDHIVFYKDDHKVVTEKTFQERAKLSISDYPKSFIEKVIKIITIDGLNLKGRNTIRIEQHIMDQLKLHEKENVEKFKEILKSEAKAFETTLNELSEEELVASFYIVPHFCMEALSEELGNKALEIQQVFHDEMQKRIQLIQDDSGNLSWGLSIGESSPSVFEDPRHDYEDEHDEIKKESTSPEKHERGDYFSDDEEEPHHHHSSAAFSKRNSSSDAFHEQSSCARSSGDSHRMEEEKSKDLLSDEDDDMKYELDLLEEEKAEPKATIIDDILKLELLAEHGDFETMSFCSNSDVEEVECIRHEEQKENEEELLTSFYRDKFPKKSTSEIFDDFAQVIIAIPDESFVDILTFFANENCFDISYPAYPDVCHYFRHLEFLMINPINQAKVIHVLTFAVNCKPEQLNLPPFEHQSFSVFIINTMKFLQYYSRSNPDSFFINTPETLSQYNYLLPGVLKPEVSLESFRDIINASLYSRIFTCCPPEHYRKDGLLREKLVNFCAHLTKVAYKMNIRPTLDEAELAQFRRFIRAELTWKSALFRRRLGKVLKYLSLIPTTSEQILQLEEEFVKEKMPILAKTLTEKWESGISQQLSENQIMLLEDETNPINCAHNKLQRCLGSLHNSIGLFYCPELQRFSGILKYFNHCSNQGKNAINLETMKGASTLLEMLCNLLGSLKDLIENDFRSFQVLSSIAEPYVYCLIHIFRDQEDLVTLAERTSKLKSLINLVFDFNSDMLSRDKPLLENLSVSSLKTLLDFEIKEKILRYLFEGFLSYFSIENISVKGKFIMLLQQFQVKKNLIEKAQSLLLVQIRREFAVYDSLLAISKNSHKLSKSYTHLQVIFSGEAGIDQGGLKKEWFTLVKDQFFDPRVGLFKTSHNLQCIYPSPYSVIVPVHLIAFKITGIIIGLVNFEDSEGCFN